MVSCSSIRLLEALDRRDTAQRQALGGVAMPRVAGHLSMLFTLLVSLRAEENPKGLGRTR